MNLGSALDWSHWLETAILVQPIGPLLSRVRVLILVGMCEQYFFEAILAYHSFAAFVEREDSFVSAVDQYLCDTNTGINMSRGVNRNK